MNELIINKICIFIQKDLYIIYMYTLITHIKTNEEKVHYECSQYHTIQKMNSGNQIVAPGNPDGIIGTNKKGEM